MTEVKSYPYGVRLKHTLKVQVGDDPEDPTSLTVYLADPSGTISTAQTPVQESEGYWTYQKTYTASIASTVWGDWWIRWIGSGVAEGAIERKFHINTSRFT